MTTLAGALDALPVPVPTPAHTALWSVEMDATAFAAVLARGIQGCGGGNVGACANTVTRSLSLLALGEGHEAEMLHSCAQAREPH